jgi:hypothetical protein
MNKHLLEFLSAHANVFSPFGRIGVIEGYMIISDLRHYYPMRYLHLVYHSHVHQCYRDEPFTEGLSDPLDRQSAVHYCQATAQSALFVLGNTENS